MEKQCVTCEVVKSLSEFYVRSGRPIDDNPTHYYSSCKDCHKNNTKHSIKWPKQQSSVGSETLVINKLQRQGIVACPGKAVSAAYVDVVAFGLINIEVKSSWVTWNYRHDIADFKFVFSPTQIKNDTRDHLIILVCRYDEDQETYHLFRSDDPILLRDGKRKPSLRAVFGAKYQPRGKAYIPTEIMERAQDQWGLVWGLLREHSEQLKRGA